MKKKGWWPRYFINKRRQRETRLDCDKILVIEKDGVTFDH